MHRIAEAESLRYSFLWLVSRKLVLLQHNMIKPVRIRKGTSANQSGNQTPPNRELNAAKQGTRSRCVGLLAGGKNNCSVRYEYS